MRLLNSLTILPDLSSVASLPHDLGAKYRSKCLPYITEFYLGVEKSDCLKLYLELCSLKILQNLQILLAGVIYVKFYT